MSYHDDALSDMSVSLSPITWPSLNTDSHRSLVATKPLNTTREWSVREVANRSNGVFGFRSSMSVPIRWTDSNGKGNSIILMQSEVPSKAYSW